MTNRMMIADLTNANAHHAKIKKAKALADTLAAEYPLAAIVADTEDNGEAERVVSWTVEHAETGDTIMTTEDSAVPEIADIVEAAQEQEIDIEGEPEPVTPGSIVPEVYRARYREASSTGQSNGDWLAERLAADVLTGENKLDADAFAAVLVANEVDQSGAWARIPETQGRGWEGRWRMNGRQQIEKRVALTGVYRDHNGTKHKPDAAWLDGVRSDHAKWIAKQEKIAEAAKPE